MFVRSDILTLSLAEDIYQLNDTNHIVQSIASIVITTVSSTRVKPHFTSGREVRFVIHMNILLEIRH